MRLGAGSVKLVCLEQHHEMPAYPEEVEATTAEGITILNGWGPRSILGNGIVTGIELKRCTSVFGYDGRFNPRYAENDRKKLDATGRVMRDPVSHGVQSVIEKRAQIT